MFAGVTPQTKAKAAAAAAAAERRVNVFPPNAPFLYSFSLLRFCTELPAVSNFPPKTAKSNARTDTERRTKSTTITMRQGGGTREGEN